MTETEAIRQNYNLGVLAGEAREQQRILKLWDEEMACTCEQPVWHLRQRIKGEN